MKGLRKVFASLVVIVVAFGLIGSVDVSAKSSSIQYVALGDSLAAGLTPDGIHDYGYPDYIAELFEKNNYTLVDYDNFGVSGYTSIKVKNDILKSSKVRKEIKSATHITIGIGANDALPKMQDPVAVNAAIKEVGANLDTTIKEIKKLNRKAKIYIMGYYNPFTYFPEDQQKIIVPLLQQLNKEIRATSRANGTAYIPTGDVVSKNYQIYLPNPIDIHLSKQGYKAVANQFWKSIHKKK